MDEFCGPYPDRLKGPIVASTRDVAEAVEEIKRWGTSKWAVAVQPLLDNDMPVDHPDLEPIWRAAEDHDLAIVHHSFTWSPPYFPGYDRDVGQCLSGAAVLAPVGRDALHGRVSRRRHPRPLSGPAALRARMRLWLAAVLGAAHGRAGELCRPHRQTEDAAERAFRRRPRLLQHRGARARADVRHGDRRLGRRLPDVRLGLPAFRIVVSATRSTRSSNGRASPASARRSCSGKTPTAASSRPEPAWPTAGAGQDAGRAKTPAAKEKGDRRG